MRRVPEQPARPAIGPVGALSTLSTRASPSLAIRITSPTPKNGSSNRTACRRAAAAQPARGRASSPEDAAVTPLR